MEYFKSGLKSVLGSQPQDSQNTGAETVETLIARVQHSTLLEDRRDACRAIRALSKKYRVYVGAHGMHVLRQVLENDRRDNEIVSYALGSLCNVMDDNATEDQDGDSDDPARRESVGEQFTEIFIKQPENVGLILGLMEEYEFNVRWPAVKLFTSMLANKPKEIQEIVLVSPMGVSKLMDLLEDNREVIRNDALLLLIKLAKGNANIQKIVAFENAFDRIFDVINEEGYADGGVVVEDCLLLLLTLLRNNISNQNFFKEGSYIIRLVRMFDVSPDSPESGWSSEKVRIIHLLLQVVRTLVNPANPAQAISSCQRAMQACGLLGHLCMILMAGGAPATLLTDTMNTVAEVIRGAQVNQDYFCAVTAPSNPPRPAVVVLLMSMVNEKQPFFLRCAVLYCFQCYLYKNEAGQAQIVQTLLPSSTEVGSLTAGQLLCGGLFNGDPLSNWFSAVALSHALIENPAMKEQLLRVLLATNVGSPPVSLLQQCSLLLQQGNKLQTKFGLLMLLSTWLSHCPAAVKQFLSIPSSIPYLTSQAGSSEHDENEELILGACAFLLGICIHFNDNSVENYNQENLRQLIMKRIGLEIFLDKLGEVSRHELYSKAAKQPQLQPKQPSELLLDHEFCRLFKALEGVIIKSITAKPHLDFANGSTDGAHALGGRDMLASRLHQKEETIKDLMNEIKKRDAELEAQKASLEEMKASIQQLKDQNLLLKAQIKFEGLGLGGIGRFMKNAHLYLPPPENIPGEEPEDYRLRAISELARKVYRIEKSVQTDDLSNINMDMNESIPWYLGDSQQIGETDLTRLQQLANEMSVQVEDTKLQLAKANKTEEEYRQLRIDHEDLLLLVADQQGVISELENKLAAIQAQGAAEGSSDVSKAVESRDD
ncbi:general vesicular transport factor p115 [Ischnura elegans]|uniref:general vesicular transport factor p115 n=1 Tax=Ischnura elegans TaxID=197161 RepID=UPI001ED86932|nr:general vesicular transport factor p115 [Ischnura elegans]